MDITGGTLRRRCPAYCYSCVFLLTVIPYYCERKNGLRIAKEWEWKDGEICERGSFE